MFTGCFVAGGMLTLAHSLTLDCSQALHDKLRMQTTQKSIKTATINAIISDIRSLALVGLIFQDAYAALNSILRATGILRSLCACQCMRWATTAHIMGHIFTPMCTAMFAHIEGLHTHEQLVQFTVRCSDDDAAADLLLFDGVPKLNKIGPDALNLENGEL